MPAEFDKQVNAVKKPSKGDNKDWRLLEFYVPIEERFSNNEDFMIRGTAINETTTLNNVKYVAKELQKAAKSFSDKKILLDHRNEVLNIVGIVTGSHFNTVKHSIDFEAKIMDKKIQEMISDGRISNVSIGAKVEDLIEEADGSMKAVGIKGLEISLVAVPGDNQANLAQAMQQGLMLKEQAKLQDKKINMEEIYMAEEEQIDVPKEVPKEVPEKVPEETPKETPEEAVAEEKTQKIDIKVDTTEISEMKKQILELKELLMKKKEAIEEKAVDKTKGEVSVEVVEKLDNINNLIVEAVGKGNYSMYRDYATENADTKLKRLIR